MILNIIGWFITHHEEIKNALEIAVIFIAGIWALYKINEFREFKHWMQFDIDANIYPMSKFNYKEMDWYCWNKVGKRIRSKKIPTHVLEILFKFTNKGKTRVKIYNIRATIFTINSEMKLDPEDGHLCLRNPLIISTGNIVPQKIGFYYIEPQVEQTITYLTLIEKPNDIIKIKGEFCLDEKRIYPKKERRTKYFFDDKNGEYGLKEKGIISSCSSRLCKFLKGGRKVIFCWDDIGNNTSHKSDDEKLKNYLIKNFYNIDFIIEAKLIKNEDTITFSYDERKLLLRYDEEKKKILMEIDDFDIDHRLFPESEKSKTIVYEKKYLPLIGWFPRIVYNRYCKRLLSHSSEKTFFVDSNGVIIKDESKWIRSCTQEVPLDDKI